MVYFCLEQGYRTQDKIALKENDHTENKTSPLWHLHVRNADRPLTLTPSEAEIHLISTVNRLPFTHARIFCPSFAPIF
jgi:hypothetical protein